MADKEFEKVKVGELIQGFIHSVQEDKEHLFKGFIDKETGQKNPDTIGTAVRFVFMFDDYEFKHYGKWERKSFGAKSNLYKKYIEKLVEKPTPDQKFDLTIFEGLPVKTIWSEKNNFQTVDIILPLSEKINL
jgi:hypothetical protein